MKISEVEKILSKAKKKFGDVECLVYGQFNINDELTSIEKLHKYTGPNGCMNREDDVFAIRFGNNKSRSDLSLQ